MDKSSPERLTNENKEPSPVAVFLLCLVIIAITSGVRAAVSQPKTHGGHSSNAPFEHPSAPAVSKTD